MTHTKEPWMVADLGDHLTIGVPEAAIARIRNEVSGRPITDEDRANANRIVACVNYCAGLRNDELEILNERGETVQKTFERQDDASKNHFLQAMSNGAAALAAQAEVEDLKRQRDEYKKDAERYRWLRTQPIKEGFPSPGVYVVFVDSETSMPVRNLEHLDAAIDAAIAKVKT